MFEKIKTWFTDVETKVSPYLHWIARKAIWIVLILVGLYFIKDLPTILEVCFAIIVFVGLWMGLSDIALFVITRLHLTDPSKTEYKTVMVAIIIGCAVLILGISLLYKDVALKSKNDAETSKIQNSLILENEYLKSLKDTVK